MGMETKDDGSWSHDASDVEAAYIAGYFDGKGWSEPFTLAQILEAGEALKSFMGTKLLEFRRT